jgi:hypothetical protein
MKPRVGILVLSLIAMSLSLPAKAVSFQDIVKPALQNYGLEVKMQDRAPIYVPLTTRGQVPQKVLLSLDDGRVLPLQITFSEEGQFAEVGVLEPTGQDSARGERAFQKSRMANAVSYRVSLEDSAGVPVNSLETHGVKTFELKVVEGVVPPPSTACTCGTETCYPKPGQCVDCGCATCCAAQQPPAAE